MQHFSQSLILISLLLLVLIGTGLWFFQRHPSSSKPSLFANAKTEQCLNCHKGIEEIHAKAPLYCTTCHQGDPQSTVKKAAHAGMIQNPADLSVVDQTCGTCHQPIADRVKRSIMAIRSGTFSGTMYLNGQQKTKEEDHFTFSKYPISALPESHPSTADYPIYPGQVTNALLPFPTYSQTKNVLVDLMRKECFQCHLWTQPVQRKADYRGTGCAACHMTYDAEGYSQSGDPTIPKKEPGHPIKHLFTKKVPVQTCATCHAGGNRIGLTFTGRMEAPARYDVYPQDLEHGHTYTDQIPDIHYEKGMVCIDCHTINEIHGDGNMYVKKNYQLEIRCQTCHGTQNDYGTGVTAFGNKLPNIKIENLPEGKIKMTLISKIDGKEHPVTQIKDGIKTKTREQSKREGEAPSGFAGGGGDASPYIAAHQIPGHMEKMECYACHTGWVPKCMGCHIKIDLTKQPTPIHVSYDHLEDKQSDFGLYTLTAGIRVPEYDYPLGIDHRGKYAPFVPRSSVVYTLIDETGKEVYKYRPQTTAKGTLGFAHNQTIPHTVRTEVRSCESCHNSDKALGLGSATSKEYPKLAPLMPADFVWDRIVDEEGRPVQETSLKNSRPLNKTEMDKIRNAKTTPVYQNAMKKERNETKLAKKTNY
ncbi:MAG: hypothetical protein HYR79_04140 [Nitrospirae bacterium]|nr:hypothetical protein [Nitrospirota bacterium]